MILLQSHGFESKEDWFCERIRHTFCDTADPLQLSEYLVEHNCLMSTDLHEIREILKWKGKLSAAAELLCRLRRQPDWIHYLLKACNSPELGLIELKLHIMDIDSAEREWLFQGEKLEYPFKWLEGREDWFYERIRFTFCSTVNPLQLSKYLIEQNFLTVTDLEDGLLLLNC